MPFAEVHIEESFTAIPTVITLTVIILLMLLFSDGTSQPAKVTSGSLAVSGCGCRYGNSAQCFFMREQLRMVGFLP